MFEKQSGLTVKTISVGTGQALALAARGEADVTLAHAPALEKKFVEDGKMRNRRLVMYNDFVIIGPEDDPARIKGDAEGGGRAEEARGATGARFVSRGDKSGTHARELALWKQTGIEPVAPWYIESGQGWAPRSASPMTGGPIPSPIAPTFLAFQKRITLPILVEKRPAAPEYLFGDGSESGQWAAGERRGAARPSRTGCSRPRCRA